MGAEIEIFCRTNQLRRMENLANRRYLSGFFTQLGGIRHILWFVSRGVLGVFANELH